MEDNFKPHKGLRLNFSVDEASHIFFTSDTHFNHNNIIGFCNRPFADVEEMNNAMIDRWNSVVKPDDTIFHLGDFAYGGAPQWEKILNRLNGHKILVLGNHDMRNLTSTIADKYFDAVIYQTSIQIGGRKIYLNHYPFLTYSGIYRNDSDVVYQLFGHVHSGPNSTTGDIGRLNYLLSFQYDVGVDNNDFTPISYDKIDTIIKSQINNTKNLEKL